MSQPGAAEHDDKDCHTNGAPSGGSLPSIAAAFLVKFDNRKGYTLAWQRSVDKLDLEGVVEFKSLPSGLHNVKEDLIYFVHDRHVGISAFLNREDEQDDRKARMLAIGVLIPLEGGRMGKSWLHADNLQSLCRQQIRSADDYAALEKYWEENKLAVTSQEDEGSSDDASRNASLKVNIPKQSTGYNKSRSMSTGTVPLISNHTLAPHHPALSLPRFLHSFGPLLLPLYRAALLRKRILFLGEAPVEKTCDYVYNLSVLSSIPRAVAESIMLESRADLRLQPLFNVGITDIPSLSARKSSSGDEATEGPGWIACTTDDVLCTKPELFDFLVILPNSSSLHPASRQYPKLVYSSAELSKAYPKYGLRASQRDARRYATLARGVLAFPASLANEETAVLDEDEPSNTETELNETSSVASSVMSAMSRKSIVEPQSWSRIAYTSLVWWASAGDKRAGLTEVEENEDEQDAALLRSSGLGVDGQSDDDDEEGDTEESKTREVAIVSYFHRLTGLIFNVLEDAVRRADNNKDPAVEGRYRDDPDDVNDNENTTSVQHQVSTESTEQSDSQPLLSPSQQQASRQDTEESQPPVEITPEDITTMGLDVWSAADRTFIEEMVGFWFGREAVVLGGKVECCGIRIM